MITNHMAQLIHMGHIMTHMDQLDLWYRCKDQLGLWYRCKDLLDPCLCLAWTTLLAVDMGTDAWCNQ